MSPQEVADCEQVAKELENSKTILIQKIQQQKQHLTELSCTSTKLGNDLVNLQDDKNMVNLQGNYFLPRSLYGLK